MKKTVSLLLAAGLAALCLSGCVAVNFTGPDGVTGQGELEQYEVSVGSFSGIRTEGACNIRYYISSAESVTLDIQPNLREYVSMEVVNGELVVRNTKPLNTGTSKIPVLTVGLPVLSRVEMRGAGSFTSDDRITADSFTLIMSGTGSGSAEVDVNRLYLTISGAGSFTLSGKADIADLTMSGAGELDAFSLLAREASVQLAGVGTVRANCSEILRIDAGGVGTVEYKGSPRVDISKGGLVSVKKVD